VDGWIDLKQLIQNGGGVQFRVRPQGEEIPEIKHLRSKAIIEFSPIRALTYVASPS
jgi:hypothetical protein